MKISLRTKTLAIVVILALVIAGVSVGICYYMYGKTLDTSYKNLSYNTAHSTAELLDSDTVSSLVDQTLEIYRTQCPDADTAPDFDSFTDSDWEAYYAAFEPLTQTEEYQSLYKTLATIRENNGLQSLYLNYLDLQTQRSIYLVDASDESDRCAIGHTDGLEEELAAVEQGQSLYEMPAYITNYQEYGWLSTSSAGVYNAQGQPVASVYVDISMNSIRAKQRIFFLDLCMLLLVVTAVLVVVLGYVVTRTLVHPINALAGATVGFVAGQEAGNGSSYGDLAIHTGDEIEKLADSFASMEKELDTYIANLANVTAEKERIGTELSIATKIQADMLPSIFPPFPDRVEFDIYASMHPAKEVGGDFYDFFMVDQQHLAIVVADVSGKGVPAALFMVIGKTLIKDHTVPGTDLGTVFTAVNNLLCESNSEGMFITAFEGVLDLVTGEFRFANAGHEMPFLARKGGRFVPQRLRAGFVLAGMGDIQYKSGAIQMEPGDRLFQYTDGVTEATNAQEELFGMKRLEQSLNCYLDAGPEEVLAGVKHDVDTFVGDAPQFDDITMLCLMYKAKMRIQEDENV